MGMRNVINLNKDWAFIQQNAGLPEEMPSDWKQIIFQFTGLRCPVKIWNIWIRDFVTTFSV